jgi:glycosyltransferase involved in cell wall biosynthesis
MAEVSVVLPNYNHGRFLEQRLSSILNQTFQDFEVIILDDCSTDNSKEIIERYRANARISKIEYNSSNGGSVFKQWQKGIALAQGNYIWIAESDDWADAHFLEKLIGAIRQESNVGICFSDSYWVDDVGNKGEDLSIYKTSFIRAGRDEVRNSLVKFNTIQNGSSALMRADLAKKYIDKIVELKACGDWLLYIDILCSSSLVFVGEKLNYFRWYHNNTSNKAFKEGVWITEGVKVLIKSNAYQLKFSKGERKDILSYWMAKTRDVAEDKRRKFRTLIRSYLRFFFIKSIFYRLMPIK